MKVNEGGGTSHEEENIEVLEIKMDEAMKMISTGEIKDAKTIILLQHIRLQGLL
jgi:GDP-mannose pyrophosphatase NudK